MGAIRRLIGLVLIAFAGWNLFMIFEDQIISQGIQSQTTGFLNIFDPIIQQFTPEPTQADFQLAIIYGVVFFVGIILLIR